MEGLNLICLARIYASKLYTSQVAVLERKATAKLR
jgi:hypothetical protein